MMYPIILLTVAISVTTGMLIFVVPQFVGIYSGMGAVLPKPTLIIISISEFVSGYGGLFTLISIVLISLYSIVKSRSLRCPGSLLSQSSIDFIIE